MTTDWIETIANSNYELIPFPVETKFVEVIHEAQENLFITAPYIKDYGVQIILANARASNLRILTNLDLTNVTGMGFDLSSLLKLWDRFNLSVSSLGKLHAKVYIADNRVALMTSANLTRGGLRENYEYGVILRDEPIVSKMLADMVAYFGLGNVFSRESIENMMGEVEEIRDLRQELDKSAPAKRVQDALKRKMGNRQTKILRNRIAAGRTIKSPS